ncbi:MAG: helix-turn-helix domain-containing protein [Magnetococcus sp. WYHC-3]
MAITVREAAEQCGVSPSRLYRLIREGRLASEADAAGVKRVDLTVVKTLLASSAAAAAAGLPAPEASPPTPLVPSVPMAGVIPPPSAPLAPAVESPAVESPAVAATEASRNAPPGAGRRDSRRPQRAPAPSAAQRSGDTPMPWWQLLLGTVLLTVLMRYFS